MSELDARYLSWHTAEPYIRQLDPIEEDDHKIAIDRGLLRFAVLRLADLALIAHREGKRAPVCLSTIARHINSSTSFRQSKQRTMADWKAAIDAAVDLEGLQQVWDWIVKDKQVESGSRPGLYKHYRARAKALGGGKRPISPSEEFRLLHLSLDKDGRSRNSGSTRVSGHPSYANVLSVLSGLAWHLGYDTPSPHLSLVVNLLKSVYPPIFILGSRSQRREWRLLSEAISKYRKNEDGEKDYLQLLAAMTTALGQ
jgi:hypothetical protein